MPSFAFVSSYMLPLWLLRVCNTSRVHMNSCLCSVIIKLLCRLSLLAMCSMMQCACPPRSGKLGPLFSQSSVFCHDAGNNADGPAVESSNPESRAAETGMPCQYNIRIGHSSCPQRIRTYQHPHARTCMLSLAHLRCSSHKCMI